MNKFELTEQLGRDKFSTFCEQSRTITKVEFTENPYDCADAIIEINNKKVIVEIKNRNPQYENYSTHFLESYKLEKLRQKQIEECADRILYVNFFGDRLYIYDVNKIEAQTSRILSPNTTVYDNGSRWKQMIELPTSQAYKYEYVDNKWRQIK